MEWIRLIFKVVNIFPSVNKKRKRDENPWKSRKTLHDSIKQSLNAIRNQCLKNSTCLSSRGGEEKRKSRNISFCKGRKSLNSSSK